MFIKFTKISKSVALLLDCILILGIGIFISVCVTVWIAKRYNHKRENIQLEIKTKALQDYIAWLKVLIFKEVESINSVLYYLKYNIKHCYTKTVNISSLKAMHMILQDVETIQICYLAKQDRNISIYEDEVYQKVFENYFYKFTTGYYQKVLDSIQVILLNDKEKKIFTDEELQELQNLLSTLEYVITGPMEQGKRQFIEHKRQCWKQIASIICCFQLEGYLQDSAEAMLYFNLQDKQYI